ncbi:MAG: beta-propeller domain-containing protein [Nitrosopumilus sp.]|uniref:beta-propeller domain-containing protein n=1 Tax=Nitrosopumilus sp. TaxID=2024843 RepID=UPI00242DA8DF|nr:beta-propeller domain-containing protein [Nitrosopumilus sp.]MCV0366373.1 beta-propeller domain-containing protein [Nitrosopumilus sp.]
MKKLDSKIILPAIAAIIVIGIVGMFYAITLDQHDSDTAYKFDYEIPPAVVTDTITIEGTDRIKKFSSEHEAKAFLESFSEQDLETAFKYPRAVFPVHSGVLSFEFSSGVDSLAARANTGSVSLDRTVYPSPFAGYAQNSMSDEDYSGTNVQVKNVDEADYIKIDGTYAYMVSENTLSIIQVYPAENAKIVTKVSLDVESQNIQNMFLNDDHLVIFYHESYFESEIPPFEFVPQEIYKPKTHALTVDVSDKESPKILRDYTIDGNLYDARMIGDYVYFVTSSGINYNHPVIPRIMDGSRTVMVPDVFYFDSFERDYNFNTVTAMNIFEDKTTSETFLMGNAGTVYVSETGFYIAYQKNPHPIYYDVFKKNSFFDVIVPMLPKDTQSKIDMIANDSSLDWNQKWSVISDVLQELFNRMQKTQKEKLISEIEKKVYEYQARTRESLQSTVIHKILLDGDKIEYNAKGEVPGRLLNQFSMDENKDRFRVAVTYDHYDYKQGSRQYNAVYVLDETLKVVGSVDGLAPDESIYSARFMGDRLYLVTFEQIDPFFVIDLSQDTPKVLGELKIPGFSNYLHSYDKDHIIGIGRDTEERSNGRVVQLGVKIALFDVSDVNHPKVLDDIIFENKDSRTEAANDHKAFLFDPRNGILSIPFEESNRIKASSGSEYDYWYGFYVFKLDTANGIELKNIIEHYDDADGIDQYLSPRSFYIEDILYTVSSKSIKMNALNGLSDEINSISLEHTGKFINMLK